jgi:hypothetical protein
MRPRLFALAFFVYLGSTEHVRAQIPDVWDLGSICRGVAPTSEGTPSSLPVLPNDLPKLQPPELALGQQQLFGVEALIGLPTGVRLDCAFLRRGSCSFQVEAFAGVLLEFPMVGAGGRFNFTLFSSERNATVLSPGLDVYGVLIPFAGFGPVSAALLAPEVQCVWFHSFGRCGLELGGNIAVPISLAIHRVAPFPFPSGVIGFRF